MKMSSFNSILLLLGVLFFLVFLVFIFRPVWLLNIWNRIRVFRAGLSKHFLKISDELEISYFERKGEGPSLLFVHGFGADKEMYCDVVRLLPSKFHVILIDLPGHGESRPNDDQSDYTIASQVDSLNKFIKAKGFNHDKKLHLIGSSMGGHIAGVYAGQYSEILSSVVLICPSGINSPEITAFIQKSRQDFNENKKTKNALLPQTVDEFLAMIKLVIYHEVSMPRKLAEAYLQLKLNKRRMHQKVFYDVAGNADEHFSLDGLLEHIKVPLLCIWGEHDKITHVSGSEVIKKKVENAEVYIIERCGHGVIFERPGKFLKIFLEFLGKFK